MAMDGSRLGNAIVDALIGAGYMPNLTGATEARVRAEWTVIGTQIVTEVTQATITLAEDDIHSKVQPGTFVESLPTTGPILGIGEGANEAVTLEGKVS